MKMCTKLTKADFKMPCKELALYLLGKVLVRKLDNGSIIKGRIVETECYPGDTDKASCTYNGRRTPGNEPLYMPEGTSYVYSTYGMYFCMNISSVEPGGAVLLRALQPVLGLELMEKFRITKRKRSLDETQFCNGPAKMCIAMNIKKETCNKIDLTDNGFLWLEDDGMKVKDSEVVHTTRIGINRAGKEWASKPFRFYLGSSECVSKKDQKAEEEKRT